MRNFDVIEEKGTRALIKLWTHGVELEGEAYKQILNVASLPFVKQVAVMPDVHAGQGATIGTVIATDYVVIPAAVGADIGCGMIAVKTSLKEADLGDLAKLRREIEKAVPHGRDMDGGAGDKGAWKRGNIPDDVKKAWNNELDKRFKKLVEKYKVLDGKNHINHLGTLGTGNHFIEIEVAEDGYVWVVIHSGSRGIGASIGQMFVKIAKQLCKQWRIALPDANLAYLPNGTQEYKDYMEAAGWAQTYAKVNRKVMLNRVLDVLYDHTGINFDTEDMIQCHHNYVSVENVGGKNMLITRKGAVSAREDEYGIIPGSMGARSYIVRGLGSKDSLYSCSHGAGRKMSRSEAKRTFSIEDHEKATAGIECRKDEDVIDETPLAYKDIDAVMEAQKDLVEKVVEFHQVICVKG